VHFRAFIEGFFENRLEVLCTGDIQGVRNGNTQPQRSAGMSFKTLFSIYICSEIRGLGIIYQCSSVMYIKRTLLPHFSSLRAIFTEPDIYSTYMPDVWFHKAFDTEFARSLSCMPSLFIMHLIKSFWTKFCSTSWVDVLVCLTLCDLNTSFDSTPWRVLD